MRMRFLLAIMLACVPLTGCQSTKPGTRITKFGPPDLFAAPIENVDIIAALTEATPVENRRPIVEGRAPKEDFAHQFDVALRRYPNADATSRNRIQDRLILASNELCENYKVQLKKKQSRYNFYSGAAATLFGAAGGVVTGGQSSQMLSALAGATSGVRAEYNGQYFSDLAAHVITKGISARRKEILAVIAEGRKKPPADYTIEMAIGDAIVYHGACSLVGGLEQADSTLSKFQNFVGLDALTARPAFVEKAATAASAAKEEPPSMQPVTAPDPK